jgi:hypothetical protein
MAMGKPEDDMAINRAFEVVFEVVKPVRCTNDGRPFANDAISQADPIGCCAILNLLLHKFCSVPGRVIFTLMFLSWQSSLPMLFVPAL